MREIRCVEEKYTHYSQLLTYRSQSRFTAPDHVKSLMKLHNRRKKSRLFYFPQGSNRSQFGTETIVHLIPKYTFNRESHE